MQSCEFAMAITAIACCIAEEKTAEELALMSSILMQLGDTLGTISARDALCDAGGQKQENHSSLQPH